MPKGWLFAIFFIAPMSAFSASAESVLFGERAELPEPIIVSGNVVEKIDGLVFWAEPLELDKSGIESVKKYIKQSNSANFYDRPFLFQFRLAGVRKEGGSGVDLTKDDFNSEVEQNIEKALVGRSFNFKCFGYFTTKTVPYCDLYDIDNKSPIAFLIEKGYLVPDLDLGITGERQRIELEGALTRAKENKAGIWKPFHGMFRGLQ